MNTEQRTALGTVLLTTTLLVVVWSGCTEQSGATRQRPQDNLRAEVSDEGKTVRFPASSPGLGLISSSPVRRGTALVSVIAPARVVANIAPTTSMSQDRIILFESPDVTSLYSQYRQGKTNTERAVKNLARTKDMYENHAATAKDVTDAETDAANARASLAEFEGKLRAAGFKPAELENAKPGTVWLISDVAETQLQDVDKGEDVDIYFSSFPDRKLIGKAEAIGEVVDPITRTVKVRVTTPNPQGRLLPGMFARVDFGDPVANVFVLSPSSITTVEGKDYVFVESAPGVFQRRQVIIQYSSASQVVVKKGLDDGERVVTAGTMLLKGLSFGY